MSKAKLYSILESLYASVLDPSRLNEFCAGMAQATGSHIGAIMVHDAQITRGRLDLLVGDDPDRMATYEQEFAADNLWVQRSQHLMNTGAVLDSDAVVSRAELHRSRYYNECLQPVDVAQSIALCALRDEHGFVTATLCRSGRLKPYGVAQLALLGQIAPHWVNAYAIQRRMSQLEQRVTTLESALERLPMAMFLLDVSLRIVQMNQAGEDLLAQGELRHSTSGLTASGVDAAAFKRILRAACLGTESTDGFERRQGSLTLRSAAGRHELVAAVHPIAAMQARQGGAETAVLFVQPAAAGALPGALKALMGRLFGLTDAEAALAEAFHRHADLAIAATACGIAVATAQTRLKLIYAKTGEHNQASLMRLMTAITAVHPG